MTQAIRIILVDDHTLFRMGLAELLERHGKVSVVGMSGNAEGARGYLLKNLAARRVHGRCV